MRKVKRSLILIVSMVLVVSMMGTNSPNVDNTDGVQIGSTGVFYYVGHGEFTYSGSSNNSRGTETCTLNNMCVGCAVTATKEDDTVFHVTGNSYLVQANGSSYTLADKLIIDHTNPEKSFKEYEGYRIPEDVINSVLAELAFYDGDFCDGFEIAIYFPSTIYSAADRDSVICEIVLPEDPGTSTFVYNGYTMKNVITSTNASVPSYHRAGSNVLGLMQSVFNGVLSVAGKASLTVSLYGALTSAYDAYVALAGPVSYATTDDWADVYFTLKKYCKETYIYDIAWIPGYQTTADYLYTSVTREFYTQTFLEKTITRHYNTYYTSTNYTNPGPLMYNQYIHNPAEWSFDPPVKLTYWGRTVILSY